MPAGEQGQGPGEAGARCGDGPARSQCGRSPVTVGRRTGDEIREVSRAVWAAVQFSSVGGARCWGHVH